MARPEPSALAAHLSSFRKELEASHQQLCQSFDKEVLRIQHLLGPKTPLRPTSPNAPDIPETDQLPAFLPTGAEPFTEPFKLPGTPEELPEAVQVSSPTSLPSDTFATVAQGRKKHMAWIHKQATQRFDSIRKSESKHKDDSEPKGDDEEKEKRVFSRLNKDYAAQMVRKSAFSRVSQFGASKSVKAYENFCTRIVQHPCFERVSAAMIFLNAIWIAVDIELNPADTLLQAPALFLLVEALFLVYFTGELFTRFWAQEHARNLLNDQWFLFDLALVLSMLVETWLVPAIILAVQSGGNDSGGLGRAATVLKVVRLLRVLRTARIARIARYMPELMILIKGMIVAARSVFFTLMLLLLMTYVFSIALLTLSEGTNLEAELFPSMSTAVLSLVLHCTMPDQAIFFQTVADESWVMGALVMTFILVGSLLVLNMLGGILVEAVQTVATMEHEQIHVDFIQRVLLKLIQEGNADEDGDNLISEGEYNRLLVKPEAAAALRKLNVDIVSAREYSKLLFEDGEPLTFGEFMESILTLRGSNQATVKDILNLRKFIGEEFSDIHTILRDLHQSVICHPKKPSM